MAEVYFIGAGPGDPELLTIKGKRIIEEFQCPYQDRTVPIAYAVGAEDLALCAMPYALCVVVPPNHRPIERPNAFP